MPSFPRLLLLFWLKETLHHHIKFFFLKIVLPCSRIYYRKLFLVFLWDIYQVSWFFGHNIRILVWIEEVYIFFTFVATNFNWALLFSYDVFGHLENKYSTAKLSIYSQKLKAYSFQSLKVSKFNWLFASKTAESNSLLIEVCNWWKRSWFEEDDETSEENQWADSWPCINSIFFGFSFGKMSL